MNEQDQKRMADAVKAYQNQLEAFMSRGLLKKKQVGDMVAAFQDGFLTAITGKP